MKVLECNAGPDDLTCPLHLQEPARTGVENGGSFCIPFPILSRRISCKSLSAFALLPVCAFVHAGAVMHLSHGPVTPGLAACISARVGFLRNKLNLLVV